MITEWRFNSRAPRGARHPSLTTSALLLPFQFTCPSRSTTYAWGVFITAYAFQFTCPSRSTTKLTCRLPQWFKVSIHVPLAEHDRCTGHCSMMRGGFNSRAPRGARRLTGSYQEVIQLFQFTCPSRSTTNAVKSLVSMPEVSIHVPLAEHDS